MPYHPTSSTDVNTLNALPFQPKIPTYQTRIMEFYNSHNVPSTSNTTPFSTGRSSPSDRFAGSKGAKRLGLIGRSDAALMDLRVPGTKRALYDCGGDLMVLSDFLSGCRRRLFILLGWVRGTRTRMLECGGAFSGMWVCGFAGLGGVGGRSW